MLGNRLIGENEQRQGGQKRPQELSRVCDKLSGTSLPGAAAGNKQRTARGRRSREKQRTETKALEGGNHRGLGASSVAVTVVEDEGQHLDCLAEAHRLGQEASPGRRRRGLGLCLSQERRPPPGLLLLLLAAVGSIGPLDKDPVAQVPEQAALALLRPLHEPQRLQLVGPEGDRQPPRLSCRLHLARLHEAQEPGDREVQGGGGLPAAELPLERLALGGGLSELPQGLGRKRARLAAQGLQEAHPPSIRRPGLGNLGFGLAPAPRFDVEDHGPGGRSALLLGSGGVIGLQRQPHAQHSSLPGSHQAPRDDIRHPFRLLPGVGKPVLLLVGGKARHVARPGAVVEPAHTLCLSIASDGPAGAVPDRLEEHGSGSGSQGFRVSELFWFPLRNVPLSFRAAALESEQRKSRPSGLPLLNLLHGALHRLLDGLAGLDAALKYALPRMENQRGASLDPLSSLPIVAI